MKVYINNELTSIIDTKDVNKNIIDDIKNIKNIRVELIDLLKDSGVHLGDDFDIKDFNIELDTSMLNLCNEFRIPLGKFTTPKIVNTEIYIMDFFIFLTALPGYINVLSKVNKEYCFWFLKNLEENFGLYNTLIELYHTKKETFHSIFTKPKGFSEEELNTLEKIYVNIYKLITIDLGQNLTFDVPELNINYINLNDVLNGTYKLKE